MTERILEKDKWGHVLFFQDGWCYGVVSNGSTICVGTDNEIQDMLTDKSKRSNSPVVNKIVDLEIKFREESINGTTIIRESYAKKRRGSTKRGGLVRSTKHQSRHAKLSTTRKGVPIR